MVQAKLIQPSQNSWTKNWWVCAKILRTNVTAQASRLSPWASKSSQSSTEEIKKKWKEESILRLMNQRKVFLDNWPPKKIPQRDFHYSLKNWERLQKSWTNSNKEKRMACSPRKTSDQLTACHVRKTWQMFKVCLQIIAGGRNCLSEITTTIESQDMPKASPRCSQPSNQIQPQNNLLTIILNYPTSTRCHRHSITSRFRTSTTNLGTRVRWT